MLIRIRDLVQRGYKYSYTFVDVGGNILAVKGSNFRHFGKEIEKCSEVMLYSTFRTKADVHLFSILSIECIDNFNYKITLMHLHEVLYNDAYGIKYDDRLW